MNFKLKTNFLHLTFLSRLNILYFIFSYFQEDDKAPAEHRYAARININSKIPGNFDPFENLKEDQLEFIFIIDCSGSMQGVRIEEAKRALVINIYSI